MVEVVAETLKTPIAFEADAWKQIELPKYSAITEIDLLVHLNVSTGADGGTPAADAPFNIIKNIQVVRGGTYFIQATGWLLHVKNYYEYKGKLRADSLPTAANTTADVYFELVIHPGYYVERKDDISVAIDARKETYLKILWGKADDLGSGYTINSGEIKVTIWHVPGMLPRFQPSWEISEKAIDQTYTDLGLQVDLPSQKYFSKAVIDVRDANGNRSDDIITEIGLVRTVPRKTELHRIDAMAQKEDDRRRYAVDPLTGIYVFDAGELGYVDILGVDTIKLAFSTKATGRLTILWIARPK